MFDSRSNLPLRLCVTSAAFVAMFATSAHAATVSSDGSRVTYEAGPGQDNRIDTSFADGGGIEVSEEADDPITAVGPNCSQDGTYGAVCAGTTVTVNLGDGNDELIANLGGGDDPPEQAFGGEGNDTLMGGAGNDQLDGGGGDDYLEGTETVGRADARLGADVLSGGPGTDALSFTAHSSAVSISLDGIANDTGGDNVMPDIETVFGGDYDDTITGDAGPNRLFGRAGNDLIRGDAGNDVVEGGRHNDQLFGDGGDDQVFGGHGNDALDGGPGQDGLSGDGGDQSCGSISCLDAASDTINARDAERDSVVCGLYNDSVTADRIDEVDIDCESVDRDADIDGGTVPGPEVNATLAGRLPRLRTALRRGIRVRVSCDQACGIAAIATVRGAAARGLRVVSAKTRTVAKGAGTLDGAGQRTVKLRFTKKAKRRLRSRRRVPITITVTGANAAGGANSVRKTVTLKR